MKNLHQLSACVVITLMTSISGFMPAQALSTEAATSGRVEMATEATSTYAVTLAAGGDTNCIVNDRGGVQCWGSNISGRLGNGDSPLMASNVLPVDVLDLQSGVSSVAVGPWLACARMSATSGLKCWGNSLTRPEAVPGATSGTAKFGIGGTHACLVTESGSTRCWGSNAGGGLGTGNFINSSVPTDVVGLTGVATAVALGTNFSCVIITGAVKCWGSGGTYGQLGSGTLATSPVPTNVVGISDAVDISAGIAHACALTAGGAVKCWGANYFGQLGDNTVVAYSATPRTVLGLSSGVQKIVSGANHVCALMNNGQMRCWGQNQFGQLGDGTQTNAPIQVSVIGVPAGVVDIAAGTAHTCVRTASSEIRCWGNNGSGQLGSGATDTNYLPLAHPYLGSGVTEVAISQQHACALTTAGGVKCWGNGQLGDGQTTSSRVPVEVTGLTSGVRQLALNNYASCAVTVLDAVKCWGTGAVITTGLATTPTDISGLATGVLSISLRQAVNAGCALMRDGSVRCWTNGALAQVVGLDGNVTDIGYGDGHACALQAGQVKCWGSDTAGVLGNGPASAQYVTTPTLVINLPGAVADIEVGGYNVCAILEQDRSAYCWGANTSGQLGNNTVADSPAPVAVSGLGERVSRLQVASGYRCFASYGGCNSWGYPGYTCAVLESGASRCWGLAEWGQTGTGTSFQTGLPASLFAAPANIAQISSQKTLWWLVTSDQRGASCAVTTLGAVWCWGGSALMMGHQSFKTNPQPAVRFDNSDISQQMERIPPQVVDPGASVTVYFRVRNLGLTTWDADTYGWIGADSWAGVSRTLGVVIPPGQTTMAIYETFAAPTTPGVYDYRAKLRNASGAPFGDDYFARIIVNGVQPTTPVPTTPIPTIPVPTTLVPTSPVPTTPVPTTSVPSSNKIVVFVHGWQGAPDGKSYKCNDGIKPWSEKALDDDFGNIDDMLHQDGWRVYYAHYTTRFGHTDPIVTSANCIATQIATVVASEPGKKITLIGHSMGGLVARAFRDKSGRPNADAIERIITLGSPHYGINAVALMQGIALMTPQLKGLLLYCVTDPGTCDLATENAVARNASLRPSLSSTTFVAGMGGYKISPSSGPLGVALYLALLPTDGPNDGTAGADSALGVFKPLGIRLASLTGTRYRTDEVHISSWGESYFTGRETGCIVGTILQVAAAQGCQITRPPETGAASVDAEADQSQVLPLIQGEVITGAQKTIPLMVDGGRMMTTIALDGPGVGIKLIAPSGIEYPAATISGTLAGALYVTATLPNGTEQAYLELTGPAAGEWQIVFSNASGVQRAYAVAGAVQSTLALRMDSAPAVSQNGQLAIQAQLSNGGVGLAGAVVSATIDTPTGPASIQLTDSGSGVYRGTMAVSLPAGRYFARVQARTSGPIAAVREAASMFEVFAPTVSVSAITLSAVDLDAINGADVLRLSFDRQIAVAGPYAMVLEVMDSSGNPVATVNVQDVAVAGGARQTIDVPAADIRAAGRNGPYQASLRILSADTMATVFSNSNAAVSGPYTVNDFTPSGSRTTFLPLVRR